MERDQFPHAVRACAGYLGGLGLRLVCVADKQDHWARQRAQREHWGAREAARLINEIEHVTPAEFPCRLVSEPDLVPLLFFSGTCNGGIRMRSWSPVVLSDLPLRGRLIATTWAAWHLVGGGYGPLDLWAWQDPGPTQPVARWSDDGDPVAINANQRYQPPFRRMSLDRL